MQSDTATYHRHRPDVRFQSMIRVQCRGCGTDEQCDFPADHVCLKCGGRCFLWDSNSVTTLDKLGEEGAPRVSVPMVAVTFDVPLNLSGMVARHR